MLLTEIQADIPKDKKVSDWYIDLHNASTKMERELNQLRREIKHPHISDKRVEWLQHRIVKLQHMVAAIDSDIEELGPRAFAEWD